MSALPTRFTPPGIGLNRNGNHVQTRVRFYEGFLKGLWLGSQMRNKIHHQIHLQETHY